MNLSKEQLKELAKEIAKQMQWPEIMMPDTAGRYIDRTANAIRHLVEDNKLPPARIDARLQIRKRDIDAAFEGGLI